MSSLLSFCIFAQGREYSWQGHILAQQQDATEAGNWVLARGNAWSQHDALFWYGESNAPYLTEIV